MIILDKRDVQIVNNKKSSKYKIKGVSQMDFKNILSKFSEIRTTMRKNSTLFSVYNYMEHKLPMYLLAGWLMILVGIWPTFNIYAFFVGYLGMDLFMSIFAGDKYE